MGLDPKDIVPHMIQGDFRLQSRNLQDFLLQRQARHNVHLWDMLVLGFDTSPVLPYPITVIYTSCLFLGLILLLRMMFLVRKSIPTVGWLWWSISPFTKRSMMELLPTPLSPSNTILYFCWLRLLLLSSDGFIIIIYQDGAFILTRGVDLYDYSGSLHTHIVSDTEDKINNAAWINCSYLPRTPDCLVPEIGTFWFR